MEVQSTYSNLKAIREVWTHDDDTEYPICVLPPLPLRSDAV